MAAIKFPLSTSPGNRPQEDQGRLFNCYGEPTGNPDRPVAFRRMPGLAGWGVSGRSGFRGMQALPGVLYAAYRGVLVRYSSGGGNATTHGTLSGEAKCFFARNSNSVPDVVVVDPDNGASYVTASAVLAYPDSNIGQPNSICSQGGYFFPTYGNGVCRASGINSTSINLDDFITAESNPDGLLRPIPFNNQLLLFGPNSCEFFSGAVVNDTGFPYTRVTATPHGLGGRYAIAGHEDGFGKSLLWVGTDNRVKMLQGGYTPTDVSPPWLDRWIAAVTDKNTLEASIKVSAGIAWWELSCDDWTVSVNLNTLAPGVGWSERESWSADLGNFTRWRGTQSHFAFDKWLIGDTQSGNIMQISATERREAGDVLRFRAESLPVAKFPSRSNVRRADFEMTTGVGDATGDSTNETDPTCEISYNLDGLNWSIPQIRSIGPQADSRSWPSITRGGIAQPCGHRWRVAVSDPVDVALFGGDQKSELR